MTDRDALFQAILANPDEDTPRLVFADWLEENGDAEYARFIRTQIELAKLPEWDPLRVRTMFVEPVTFHLQNGPHRPRLPLGLRWDHDAFRRGFASEVAADTITGFVKNAPAVFAVAPVQALKLWSNAGAPTPSLAPLADSASLARLRCLYFRRSRLGEKEIRQLQDSPHAANLTELAFEQGIDPLQSAVSALFSPPIGPRLTAVRFIGNGLGPGQVWFAIREVDLGRLRRLTFAAMGPTPLQATIHHTAEFIRSLPAGLLDLDLSDYEFGPGGVAALADAPATRSLQSLDLKHTRPGVPGVSALAGSAALAGLRVLRLASNSLGPTAANVLARSRHLAGLRILDLSHNPIGDTGAVALAESPHLTNLVQLELMHCGIGDKGAGAFLASPVAANLVRLSLLGHSGKNTISDRMKGALKKWFGNRVFV